MIQCGLCVGHNHMPCNNSWTDRDVIFEVKARLGSGNHILKRVQILHKTQSFSWASRPLKQIVKHIIWGLGKRMSPEKNYWTNWDVVSAKKHVLDKGTHRCHLANTANTVEWSVHSGDAVCCYESCSNSLICHYSLHLFSNRIMSSVLWHCCLGVRNSIWGLIYKISYDYHRIMP